MSLIGTFLEQAEARPEAVAIIDGAGRRATFGDLARESGARAAAMRRMGIGVGDAVLVARGVSIELYETLLAIFRLGAVATFPEPAAGIAGVRHAIRMATPKAFAGGALARVLRPFISELRGLKPAPDPAGKPVSNEPMVEVAGDAPALITFTSGSTGAPKGIVRSVDFLLLQHRLLENLRRTSPDDVDLISLPVFILSNLAVGAASVIPKGKLTRPAKLDGGVLAAQMRAERVNRVIAPPAVCARIVESGEVLGDLNAMFTGGGPVFPNLLHGMRNVAPKAALHAVYGSTEAEPIAHVAYDDISEDDWRMMGEGRGLLAGAPIEDIEVALVDDEVQVAGPHVNRGYLDPKDDASTKVMREGVLWHRTGDAARTDERGRLWLLGRTDAASDGIFPFAVETAALSWPGVQAAGFAAVNGRKVLAVSGSGVDTATLASMARGLGDIEVVRLDAVPMDKRHNSKVDYGRLKRVLG